MNCPRPYIKETYPLIDFAYYGSKARRKMHPEVLIGSNRGCPTFKEGDILDGNAILNLIKCVRWEEWSYGEKIDQHITDTTIHVTQEEKDRWDNNVSTQADWNEENPEAPAYILNKPDIYTKTLIDQMLATKADTSSLSTVATSGSYNDLTDTPTIPIVPTNVSAFNNDAGYLTEHQSLDNYYTKSQVDTLNSQQDTVIAEKAPQATTYTKTEVNALVSPKANLADLATVATSGSYNDLSNKPTIPTVPTNVSAFVNDAGYLTQHQSLDNYYNKTQVDTKLDGKQDVISNLATIESGAAKGATSLQPSDKAVANGLATLNETGIIPSSQLPSYVDDVLEYESSAEFPVTGESGKIYVDLFTNKTYRWGGSGYVEISESLALGETSSTAYAGDKGKATTDAFNAHASNTDIHVTAAKQAAWDAKADVSYVEDNYLKNYIETDPTGGHDYVEIGGIKWATMNIGSESVTDYGLYFQWGDTQGYTAEQVGSGSGKKYFGWEDYKYGNGTSDPGTAGMTKYNSSDHKTVLDASDDAVTAAWGNNWRMPTTVEFQALGAAVNTEWTDNYQGSGVKGLVCTDKTDSSKVLFFPATGFCRNGSVSMVGSLGVSWSSSRGSYSYNVHQCYDLNFNSGDVYWQNDGYRDTGCTVRGVYIGSTQRIPVSGATDAEKTSWNNKSDFSGSYNDLTDKPTIPDELVDLQDDSTHRLVTDTEKSTWNAKSDFSGSYNDLTNKPIIPAAQVNSDWSANTGVAQILNKPTLSTVATSGSYNDLSNKPSIPSIWTGTQVEYDAIVVKDPDTIYIIKSTS